MCTSYTLQKINKSTNKSNLHHSVIRNGMFDWWFCDSFCSFYSPRFQVKQIDNDTKVKQLINRITHQWNCQRNDNIHKKKNEREMYTHIIWWIETSEVRTIHLVCSCTKNEIDHLSTPSMIICVRLCGGALLFCIRCDKISVLIFHVASVFYSTCLKSYKSSAQEKNEKKKNNNLGTKSRIWKKQKQTPKQQQRIKEIEAALEQSVNLISCVCFPKMFEITFAQLKRNGEIERTPSHFIFFFWDFLTCLSVYMLQSAFVFACIVCICWSTWCVPCS